MTNNTLIVTTTKLDKDNAGVSVVETEYRGMIASLLYLSTSRPEIINSVGICTRFQSSPKESHLKTIKRIFKYLKDTQELIIWYPTGDFFNLVGYADDDYPG